jgi:glutamate/tyrosine decarboxylase-like PLP-dependent enzyme
MLHFLSSFARILMPDFSCRKTKKSQTNLIPEYSEPTHIGVQADNVNTGAFDPIGETCEIASTSGAWVHVDGAFGLWTAASPRYAHYNNGFKQIAKC